MNRLLLKQRIESQHFLIFAFGTLVYSYNQGIAQAQTAPSNIPNLITPVAPTLPPRKQPETPQPLPSLPSIISPATTPKNKIPLPPESIPGSILIKRFDIVGNEVLSDSEIAEIVEPYTLRRISFIELLEVPRKITQLYIDKGYITSGATILPQTIKDRVVKIQIIPGTIEETKITGTKQLKESYVRNRLKKATTAPLNQHQLLKALQLLQVDPLISNVSAELSAGIAPNSSVLKVDITEADTFRIGLNFDNHKVASIGTFSRQIELEENNVSGIGDRLNVAYTNTDGSNALSNLSYELPLNTGKSKLKLTYNYADNDIVQQPFESLNIENDTQYYDVSYTHSLSKSIYKEIKLGINFTHQSSKTTFLDDRLFPNTIGATNSDGETKITTLGFFQDYVKRNEQQVFFARSQFTLGIDALDSAIDDEKPDSEFVAWRGYVEYLRALSRKNILSIRSNIQLSNDSLAPLSQFTVGGAFSVRGYPQNILLGDNGVLLSTEIRHALIKNKQKEITLEIIPFIDFGKAWNTESRLEQSVNTLASIGTGLQLSIGRDLTAKIDWGIPLIEVESAGDSLQENGIYFSLRSNL